MDDPNESKKKMPERQKEEKKNSKGKRTERLFPKTTLNALMILFVSEEKSELSNLPSILRERLFPPFSRTI